MASQFTDAVGDQPKPSHDTDAKSSSVGKYESAKFFHVGEAYFLRQKKSTCHEDGSRAVGTSGVFHCVGMYIELGEEYFCWHILGGLGRQSTDRDVEGTKDYNEIRDGVIAWLRHLVEIIPTAEARQSLIVTTSEPAGGTKALIEGVLTWAGVPDREEWKRTSGKYGVDKTGFIINEPGNLNSLEWLTKRSLAAELGHREAIPAGKPDGRIAVNPADVRPCAD